MKKKRELVAPQEGPPVEDAPDPGPEAVRQAQILWLTLAKRNWSSLAVLPAGRDSSIKDFVRVFTDVGTTLSNLPVSAVTANLLEAGAARSLAGLAEDVREWQRRRLSAGDDFIEVAPTGDVPSRSSHEHPAGKLIVGLPSVVSEPVALAVVQAADTVILGVELGKTTTQDLRRSIDLIGRDRIAGCVLI